MRTYMPNTLQIDQDDPARQVALANDLRPSILGLDKAELTTIAENMGGKGLSRRSGLPVGL